MARTPISDHHAKQDMIDTLHLDYDEALRLIVQAFLHIETKKVRLLDIFEEGLSVLVDDKETPNFIPFQSQENFEKNVWQLACLASAKTKKSFKQFKDQYFQVIQQSYITTNILRIELFSDEQIPDALPGYAWCFTLTHLKHPFLNEEKHKSLSRRYYTLRKGVQEKRGTRLFLDIYLHENSEGSLWAKSLSIGCFIHSCLVYLEKTDFLHQGKSLLIADETSLPTIARLLELWTNPIPPNLIILTHSTEERIYLNEISLPHQSKIYYLNYQDDKSTIYSLIDKMSPFDKAWAALESQLAKNIRHYIRQHYSLPAEHCRIKTYWV